MITDSVWISEFCGGHVKLQGGSNMTGTNCDLFRHNQSRLYLNHLVFLPAKFVIKEFPSV